MITLNVINNQIEKFKSICENMRELEDVKNRLEELINEAKPHADENGNITYFDERDCRFKIANIKNWETAVKMMKKFLQSWKE